jgi:carboxymethylenebutenolidase
VSDCGELWRQGPNGRRRPRPDSGARDACRPSHIKVYPSAGHCFLNDEINGPTWLRPVARRLQRFTHVGPEPMAATDAWRRIESFFAEHLY